MTIQAPPSTDGRHADRSIADLSRDLSHQATELVRQEIELAKAELAVKGRRAGAGAGMFGGAGTLGFYAFGALTAAAIAALATAVATWLAALIVGGAYLAIAGILALTGKKQVAKAGPPVPERALESVKEDVAWTKTRAQDGRQQHQREVAAS